MVLPQVYLLDLAGVADALVRVAESAGFSSAHQLRRVWQRHEDGTPRGALRPRADHR